MFSNRLAIRRPHTISILALFVLVAAAGCGRKGDPQPPLRIIPGSVQDLRVSQQGGILRISMSYPATTTSGAALGGVDAVELLQLSRPAPEGVIPVVDALAFDSAAEPLMVLRGPDLAAATTGGQLEVQVPLTLPLPDPAEALIFGVRSEKDGRVSSISNRATILPATPPQAPAALALTPSGDGVRVGWRYEVKDGDDEPGSFRIYRRDARVRGYGNAVGTVEGDQREWLDRGARFGDRYIYTVRTVLDTGTPILSAESGEREIDYQDRFAPPLPARFVALPERGTVRLRWERSRADDVAGYIVYRRDPGREFVPVQDKPITGLEYLDEGLASGLTFEYRIQTIDRLGNESALSQPVKATPR